MLADCGNSDMAERMALMNRFCAAFGKEAIAMLVADREFIGAQWFDFLVGMDIPFVIRVKQNQTVVLADGRRTSIGTLFSRRLWRSRETCWSSVSRAWRRSRPSISHWRQRQSKMAKDWSC